MVSCHTESAGLTEMDSIGPDQGLKAGRRLAHPGGRLGEGDKSLRTEAETGESETTHREAIARDVVPCGVGLKGWLARLLDRRCRTLFRFGGRGRTRSQHHENANREAKRDEEEETIAAHERLDAPPLHAKASGHH